MNILVIEDIKFSSLILERQLKNEGHKVYTAACGYDALELLESGHKVDAVVCDLYLPDMDGFTIFRECETIYDQKGGDGLIPPFILLTSSKNHQDLVQAEAMGFVGALSKPLVWSQMKELLTLIDDGNHYLKNLQGNGKILVVDSAGKISEILQSVFNGTGYTMMIAESGSQAIDYLFEFRNIAMVVCDMNLQDTNAMGLLKDLRSVEDTLPDKQLPPFILMTESGDVDMLQIAQLSGFSDIITPPLEKFAIKQKLSRLFQADFNRSPDRKTILIIDDIGFHCMLSKTTLGRCPEIRDEKYTYLTASNGQEALEILKSDTDIQLVITDYYLPDLNGIEIYEDLKSIVSGNVHMVAGHYELPPFVLLTISTDEEIASQALESGFAHVFKKPLNPTDFVPKVQSLLKPCPPIDTQAAIP